MEPVTNELAPCGIFCGACPAYMKTCLGCPSESRDQKRTSKWSCKIRDCCYHRQQIAFCIDCSSFPCKIVSNKLFKLRQGDPRFRYRDEIIELFPRMRSLGVSGYLAFQQARWTCPDCGGRVRFYEYRCSKCGKEVMV